MSNHLPIGPDPMPLREALRGLRHVLRKGGRTFAETLSTEGMPEPAAALADTMLREAEGIFRNIDNLTSGLAKTILGGETIKTLRLSELPQSKDGDLQFSQAVYVALRSVLDHLGAPDVFISEAAARSVYKRAIGRAEHKASTLSASLTLDLLSARIMRGTTALEAARVPGAALEAVAMFAVMLWLQSDRSDAENRAALDAASDLAIAIAPDIAKAFQENDSAAIAALYEKYAPHV